jgi:hypothetical protein
MDKLYRILEDAQSVVNCDLFSTPMSNEILNFSSDITPLHVPSTHIKPVTHKAVKASKKRAWKKPKDKPKRPLSAYNLFFQEERNSILAALPSDSQQIDDGLTEEERRRKHRKTHGKIGFADLARSIATKWKNCEPKSRASFEARAESEKQRYKVELAAWKKAQEGTLTTSLSDKKISSSVSTASDECHSAMHVQHGLIAAVNKQNTQPLIDPEPFMVPSLMHVLSSSALMHNTRFNERPTGSSSVHGCLMAQCAANLLKQSPGFHMPLAVFAQHMNGSRMQTPAVNPLSMNDTMSFPSQTHPSLRDDPFPEESFSKETFFETSTDDDDESTCTTSGLFSEFSEADDGDFDRAQTMEEELNHFLYDFGNEVSLS